MERKRQFSNIAFGGDWSETLLDHEQMMAAVATVVAAAQQCADYDIRGPALDTALSEISARFDKGPMLVAGFRRALDQTEPSMRQRDAERISDQIRDWAGR